jgi:hypothetical protein
MLLPDVVLFFLFYSIRCLLGCAMKFSSKNCQTREARAACITDDFIHIMKSSVMQAARASRV